MSTTAEAPANGAVDPAVASAAITGWKVPDLALLPDAVSKFTTAILETKDEVVESDDLVDASYTAIASRTHLYVVGEGGSGKTFGGERTFAHFEDRILKFYEQMRADMKREEIFGPLSMRELQNDRYVHATKGYAPEARLWILDEIKDALRFNRQFLNALNEGWMVNGGVRCSIPLDSCQGLTNFWMDEPELAALFDRFAQRMKQEAVKTSEGFKKILRGQVKRRRDQANGITASANYTKITVEELDVVQYAVDVCDVHDDIYEIVDKLWQDANAAGLQSPSPRRYGEGIKLAQAVAVLAGRDHVTEADLRIYARVLPGHPDEFTEAKTLTNGFRDRFTEAIDMANASLAEIVDLLAPEREKETKGADLDTSVIFEARTHFTAMRKQVEAAKKANAGRDHQALDRTLEGLAREEQFVKEVFLGL